MDDVTQHSNRQLSTILRNPNHPMHSAAKAERDRRMAKREDNDLDEINLKDLTKTIAKSTGTKNLQKALKKSKDQTKMDLAALRKKLQAEKTLTPAEIKKREEIAKAMERDNPDMPMAKKMAIATATAKKVAEDVDLDEAKIISRKPHPDGGHIVKLKTDGGQTVTRHLKNGKVKTMKVHNESVELDEDVTHQTVKPPNHTKKYSGDAHAFGPGKNKPKVVTSSQADAHDKTADHHRTVADAHRAAAKKTSSMKLKHLHNTAANAHDKAAEAHNDASHSSDGSLTKTAGHMSRAYHSTMSANDHSKRARNLGTKTKRMNEETLQENRVDALAKDFHNRLKKAGNSDRNQNRERMATLAKAKKQGLSAIEMKQLDGKMNAIMNKMDESVNEISAKKYHAALKGREYKRDRARNSAGANKLAGNDAEADADMAKSKDHDRKLKKMKQMGINRTARNLGEKAPKIDDAKYAAHMARHDKPKKMSSTQKSLADIRRRAEK